MSSLPLKNSSHSKKTQLLTNHSNHKIRLQHSNCSKTLSVHKQQPDQISNHDEPQKKGQQIIEQSQINCQNYFLRKTILTLYNFFERMQKRWNLNRLNYQQMTLVLKELRYIKNIEYQNGVENSEQAKKCYYLWVNLSQARIISLSNLIIILCHIHHLEIDTQLIEDIAKELQKGISKFQQAQQQNGVPNYIFLVRKQDWQFKDNLLCLTEKQIKQIRNQLTSLRYTRWTQNQPKIEAFQEQKPCTLSNFMSKKSIELANNKRLKIQNQLKQRQIAVIELHHFLSYKQQQTKMTTSKLQQLPLQPSKQNKYQKNISTKSTSKRKPMQYRTIKNPQNKENQNQNQTESNTTKKEKKNKETTKKHNQSIGEDLALSEITKTQIIEEIEINQTHEDQIKNLEENLPFSHQAAEQVCLPHTLNHKYPEQQKKRREYIDIPILYVDVNIDEGKKQRIVVYDGDTAAELAQQFGYKHGLSPETVQRLQLLLKQQIGSVLSKIDQALEQDCSYLY